MTNEELKLALLDGQPVTLTHADGHEAEYEKVTAIVYRVKNGRIFISAEVLDKGGRCVVHCDPARLKKKGGA